MKETLTTTYCDRCNSTVNYGASSLQFKTFYIFGSFEDMMEISGSRNIKLDLCKNCQKEFTKWLTRK